IMPHLLSLASAASSSCPRPPPHRAPPSFPTRRSSDLARVTFPTTRSRLSGRKREWLRLRPQSCSSTPGRLPAGDSDPPCHWCLRSEEHTSELQSLTNIVCRLLLEKKKRNKSSALTLIG